MKKYYLTLFLFFLHPLLSCIDGLEIELWEECYNIEETTILDLSGTQISGSIPEKIGDLENLIELNLSLNNLDGEIPNQIGNLTNLVTIRRSLFKIESFISKKSLLSL